MKKFIIKLSIFIILIFSLLILLDNIISSGLKKSQDYRYQSWNEIINSKLNSKVIIIGNSRALSHFSPQIIDSVLKTNSYNLGIGGHPLNVQLLKYHLYLQHNTKPKYIIQNVDFMTFEQSNIEHEREQVYPFVNNYFLKNNLSNYGFSNLEIHLPFYRYYGNQTIIKNGILSYFNLKKNTSLKSYKGFKPEHEQWNSSELNKLSKIKTALNKNVLKLFEKHIIDCKKQNIKLILVNSPLYYKAFQKIDNYQKLDTYLKTISTKYNIPYLDYTKDSLSYDSLNFNIAIHLNSNGAALFSKNLASDLAKFKYIK